MMKVKRHKPPMNDSTNRNIILTFAFYKLMKETRFSSACTSNDKELKQKI